MFTRTQIATLADRTVDAYSRDRFASWTGCIALLGKRGYDERTTYAILMSKHMRWAGDSANQDSNIPTSALAAYLDDKRNAKMFTAAELATLVAQTVGA